MLNFTDTAVDRVRDFLAKQAAQGVSALRVAGTRKEHRLWLVKDRSPGRATGCCGSMGSRSTSTP
jgi:hypothetical protein